MQVVSFLFGNDKIYLDQGREIQGDLRQTTNRHSKSVSFPASLLIMFTCDVVKYYKKTGTFGDEQRINCAQSAQERK